MDEVAIVDDKNPLWSEMKNLSKRMPSFTFGRSKKKGSDKFFSFFPVLKKVKVP